MYKRGYVFGLSKILINKLVKEIRKYKKTEKIVIFGSRAAKNFKVTSDIDIAIFGKDWSDKDVNIVKYTLDEIIRTPLKLDIVNFYAIKKHKLKEEILNKGRIIYPVARGYGSGRRPTRGVKVLRGHAHARGAPVSIARIKELYIDFKKD